MFKAHCDGWKHLVKGKKEAAVKAKAPENPATPVAEDTLLV